MHLYQHVEYMTKMAEVFYRVNVLFIYDCG